MTNYDKVARELSTMLNLGLIGESAFITLCVLSINTNDYKFLKNRLQVL